MLGSHDRGSDMKTVPVEVEISHPETGEVFEKEIVQFKLLPCAPGTCARCGVEHEPAQPHNAQSLYYQYRFYGEHGRWPTWADAVFHCEAPMQALGLASLRGARRGAICQMISCRSLSPMRCSLDRAEILECAGIRL